MRPLKVVYILGAARSGSTLFTSLLGELPGFFAAAETRLLWHGLERRRCGCGRLALECDIWSEAVRGATSHSGMDPGAILRLQNKTTRLWHLPSNVVRRDGNASESLTTYTRVMAGVYAGLGAATGARVIVDSSKNASEALLLQRIPFVEPHVVHLVRDPRAVVFSWRRAALRGRAHKKYGRAAATAARWLAHNVGARVVSRAYEASRTSIVRYEDFVHDPKSVLGDVVAAVDEPGSDLTWLEGAPASRASRHMIGGNALREAVGPIELREDTDWRRALARRDVAAVNAVVFPLASRYGYPLRVKK
jgi:hypothetical protein